MQYSIGLVLKQPQRYSNLHSNLTKRNHRRQDTTVYNYYSCTEAARSMARSTIQLLFESWPTSTWFFQSKRNLNTVDTQKSAEPKTCHRMILANLSVMSIETISAAIPLQHPSEPSLSRSHWLRIRPFCSWETGEEEGFIRDGRWVSRQRRCQVLLPKEKGWKHSFFVEDLEKHWCVGNLFVLIMEHDWNAFY